MAGTTIEITEYHAPDGEVYRFTAGAKFLLSEEGLGMPDIKYITQKGPQQHGETILGYQLEPRTIQMLIRQNGCSREEYWQNRRAILDILRPNRQINNCFKPGTLRKIFHDGSMRDIDVFIANGPIFSARSLDRWDEWSYQETIRFIAPDPTFYDPVQFSATASVSASSATLIFYNASTGPSAPGIVFRNPVTGTSESGLLFTAGLIDTTVNATNSGDWPVFPSISITGPVHGAVITNQTTDETIRINYDLEENYTIIVSLAYGEKRVYIQETGENIIGSVSSDSDLTTFHLEPAPGATNGVNTIGIFGGQAQVGATEISVFWKNRYIGI